MAEFLDHRILLLVISFLTSLQSTKLLSEWKKCGDQECETAMSRVQGTKDYIGPDCRYLKFKMGEEIIVYSKLSRKREDLWAGSKGKDFGYFPKDAVQSEDVFITQEVEVQTKETDFLCLDGGEYLLENKDSVLHDHDEESEYPLPYTEQKEPESKMPEGELQKQTSISFQKEHGVESVPENDELDRTFKDPHTREETQSNKLFRNNKNGKDDAVLQEAESSHPLKPAPIQSTWTISGIVGWLDLGSKQDEVAFETVTESVEENTFRSRKIAISDESDMKELNDEDKPEPSGWFQSRLTDLLHFGRENSGLDLLSKENSPQIYDSSSNAAHSDFEHRTTAADISTEEQQKSDSEVSKSSWFNLGLSDVFTFGHSNKENAITKEEQNREMEVATNKNEEIQTSSPQETESQMDIELKKEIPKAMIGEEQNDKKNNVQEILDSDNKTPSSGVLPVNEDNPLNFKSTKNAVESSFTIEVADKLIEPYSSEQDPVSESQVVENTEVKEITQESKSINGQSGWYENMYSNLISFNRDTSDNQQRHESAVAHGTQESFTSQLYSFPNSPQSLDPTVAKNSEEKHDRFEKSQSLFSFSHFTNILSFHSLTTKVKESVQSAQEDLDFSKEISQSENNDEILQGSKETAEKLQANQRVSENVRDKRNVAMSQESILLSPLAVQSNEQNSEKSIQDAKLVKENNTSPLLSTESQLEPKISQGQHSQISRYSNSEEHISDGSERQEFSNIKDNSDVPISKDQQHASLDLKLENTIDSPLQHEYISEDFYSSEQHMLSKEEPIEQKEDRTDKNEEMHTLNLQEPETYIERKSKQEIAETMQDEGQNNLQIHEQESVDSEYDTQSSGELPANLDSLLNFKKIPNEAESSLTQEISDKTKLTELYSTEQNSATESQVVENTEVKSKSKNYQAGWYENISGKTNFNMDILNDQKEQESIVSQDTQESVVPQLLSSSGLSQDSDTIDTKNSEKEKQSQFEEPQSLFSFSHYKNIMSFQSFTTKDEHSLQRLPENLSFDDENGQSKNDDEILLGDEEIELKVQTNQKINDQVVEKSDVDISKESALFSRLTVQNIEQDSENTMKDTRLVKDSSLLSFTESQLEHKVESLFSYPKCKEHNSKSNEREEFSNIKEKSEVSILEDEQQVSSESKLNIKDSPEQHGYFCEDSYSSQQNISKKVESWDYLAEKFSEGNGHELGIDHSAGTKKVQVSDQLSSLEFDESLSTHHLNNEVQGHDVSVDSEEERELIDVEYTENSSDKGLNDVSEDSIKDNFSKSNVDDMLDKIVVNREDMSQFPQDRVEQPENFSQHVSKCGEDNLEHSEQMITNYEPNKSQNEKRANNQASSSIDAPEDIIKSEKIIPEQDSHTLNYLLYGLQNKGNELPQSSVPFPQEQRDEAYNKREHISNPSEQCSDNIRISEDSLIVNVLGKHVLQEQIIAPDASADTFAEEELQSQQISLNIPHHKKELTEITLDDSSFQHEPLISECGIGDNTNSDPGKKYKNQMLHNKRKESSVSSDLEVPESSSSSHHENMESIHRENESGYQKISSYPHSNDNVTPTLLDVSESQKMSEESLVTRETTAESNDILLTEHKHLFQEQSSVVENSEKRNLALHLESFESTELQSQEPLKNHGDSNPNKPLSHILHYHDSSHKQTEHVPSPSEQGLDTLHINAVKHMDLNDKRHIGREDALPTENINHIEKLTTSEKARESKEKSKKDTKDKRKADFQNINDKNDVVTKGVVDRIFMKTSLFLGSLFSKNNNEDFRRNSEHKNPIQDPNENRENIRINQIKVEFNNMQRTEAELKENESEQENDIVQTAEATNNLNIDHFKMLKDKFEKRQLSIEKKNILSETGTNKEIDKPIIWETGCVSQQTRKEGKRLIDWDTDISNPFIAYQQLHSKLSQEVTEPLKSLCERNKLLLLEKQFKKVQHDITTFTCEDSFMQKKQVISSVEEEHNLDIGYDKCMKEKMNFLRELQDLLSAIRMKCEAQNAESDISDERKLSGKAPKEEHHMHTALYNERNRGQHSKAITIAPVNAQEKMYNSVKNVQLDVKKPLSQIFFLIQKYIPNNEEDWIYQILLHLNGLDIGDFVKSVFSAMAAVSIKVKSRLYIGREKQLASEVAELLEDKCKVLEKLSLYKKEYEDLELSLKDASLLKESTDTSHIEATCEKLNKSNAALKDEIENLEKELKEEKSKRSEQDDSMAEMQRRMESLENEAKSIQSQVAEAKTTLKVFHINKERLETSVQDAIQENFHLQESEKQLLQEAEGWGERFSELNEQTKMFESSKADMEEALKNKESQVKSLTECLLKMKDWSSAIEEDNTEDNHWDVDIKGETENGELLDDQQKRTIKKLIYAAKLNACLKTLEAERNQVYLKLADEDKAKEELTERIENLQSEQVSLQSENAHFESEIQKLQQKLKVMTELYQENEMKLHRKLTVEERERLQKEEKLSKVDEKINHAAEELNSYRQRAKDLEEELDRTIHSYQSQITSHEKKAHDNWLTARAAERHLNDMRKENAHNRQKLTEMEFKFDLLEKDPYALDVPIRPFGREHSPYGPSPMGRPPSETRAFLSPPTLLEGPLRLSPMLPGGGGRGSRGAGNPAMYEAANERGELSSDRLSDPHRAPSDTGSLSPPWDRDRKIILPPSGQPYNDPTLPPRRPERFYSNPLNSGRLSGPAELRSYNMQSFDKADGQASPENSLRTEPSGNETKDHPNFSNFLNVSDQSLAPESEVIGSGFAPPPLPPVRAPLLPVDPRGPFIRRGPPFPPPPPIGMYGPREYFPRDFAGLPRPSLAMRNPFPLRPFSQYPPQRAGSFLPPPPLENRSELSPGLIHQSDAPATGHPEPQQET
ncbi:melanoma inhibitory activity protein 2 isoform X2 [Emydura macquarii macquarii]|uniref:melanoma inhibitory activity protein 2 isoform X2 n=1 Tax=Emydura macquarii macquarii TaxID=1129001 RepID=UPI00352AC705